MLHNMCNTQRLIYLRIIIISVVLIGSLNWGLIGLVGINLVQIVSNLFNKNHAEYIEKFLYILVGACGIFLIINRNTFLPFLGPAAFPEPLVEKTPILGNSVKAIVVKDIPPNTKVIYWASKSSDKIIDNPIDAYGNYENQGVAISNEKGEANLVVNDPTGYIVPSGRELKPHIHYRYWTTYGITSEVKTVMI